MKLIFMKKSHVCAAVLRGQREMLGGDVLECVSNFYCFTHQ